jgi:NHLM bacteriocin system ABC transporter peptidase/ATP-binding protein
MSSSAPEAPTQAPVQEPKSRKPPEPKRYRRAKTPTILQMEAVECGAAALGIVLAYYGKFVALEQLRVQCGVSRDGSNAAALLRAARNYGLEAKGFQMEASAARELKPPFIVFWNFNHFLVIEGFKGDEVLINDPAAGPRGIPWTEFDGSFTGILLTFEPGPAFEKGGKRANGLSELRNRLTGTRSALALIFFVSLMLVVPGIAVPGFLRVFVDRVLTAGIYSWVWPLLGFMLFVAALMALLTWFQQRSLLQLETRLSIVTSTGFLRHVLRLPVEFFAQRPAADISLRVTTNDSVAQLLSRDLATAVVSGIVAVFYAVLLIHTDVVLALIGIGLAAVNILVLRLVARLRRDANIKLQQDRGKLVAATYNGLQLLDTLKASGRESDYFERWSGQLANVVSGSQRLGIPTQVLAVVPLFLASLNSAFILLVGSHRALAGAITIGLLVAFQSLLTNFNRPVSDLSDLGAKAQAVNADIARIRDVERYPVATIFSRPPTGEARRLSGGLRLEDITFGYSPLQDPLIKDFNLTLTPGSRVALVGGSGSGKSTIARMIAGLHEPWSGRILFDDTLREDIPRQVLAASVAVVDQDIFLFEGTVRDNLTMWDSTVPDDVLISALKDAAILDAILQRNGRLDGKILEGGSDLSGGQRQRLEIARALAVNPSLLILDEATSALDAETERQIDASLRRRGCTCVIVAHRLSTIRDADEILVMRQGEVVERGTHELMRDNGGPYAELIRAG